MSGCVAIVKVEEATQARPCFDGSFAPSYLHVSTNDAVAQSLVVSLAVVVLHIFSDGVAKMVFAKGDDLVQTLGFGG